MKRQWTVSRQWTERESGHLCRHAALQASAHGPEAMVIWRGPYLLPAAGAEVGLESDVRIWAYDVAPCARPEPQVLESLRPPERQHLQGMMQQILAIEVGMSSLKTHLRQKELEQHLVAKPEEGAWSHRAVFQDGQEADLFWVWASTETQHLDCFQSTF